MFVDVKAGETTDIGKLGDVQQESMTKGSGRLDRKRVDIQTSKAGTPGAG